MSSIVVVFFVVLLVVLFVILLLLKRAQASHQVESQAWRSERIDLQRQADQPNKQLTRLLLLLKELQSRAVSPTGHLPRQELAQTLVDSVGTLLQAGLVILFQVDPATLDYSVSAAKGLSPDQMNPWHVRVGEGPLGRALLGSKAVYHEDSKVDPIEGLSSGPYLLVPLFVQSRAAGLIVASQALESRFATDALELVEALSGQASLSLENLDLAARIERYYDETVRSLARAIDAKDANTHGHSHRTRQLARALGEEIHLPETLIRHTEYGALLHDIGKIGIEDRILGKPDKLTPEEYAIMKRHPAIGHQILQPLPFLQAVSTIVLYHQEWVNGGGYPEGLAGEEIPLGARLVAVIDAWDAMTSDRPYRKAMPRGSAITELRRQAGTQFDSKMVDAFLRVIERLDREGIPTTESDSAALASSSGV